MWTFWTQWCYKDLCDKDFSIDTVDTVKPFDGITFLPNVLHKERLQWEVYLAEFGQV